MRNFLVELTIRAENSDGGVCVSFYHYRQFFACDVHRAGLEDVRVYHIFEFGGKIE